MARKTSVLDSIVQPTRAMTSDQLREQIHFARRAKRQRVAGKGFGKGGRSGDRRAAIAAF